MHGPLAIDTHTLIFIMLEVRNDGGGMIAGPHTAKAANYHWDTLAEKFSAESSATIKADGGYTTTTKIAN